jgi:arylsulfatase A-like enzyme
VVFILVDDLGYGDLPLYGHRFIETPNLDQLAAQGMTMKAFYAPSPLCSPSRASMMTGRTPYRTGIKSWIPENDNIYLSEKEVTIASMLKKSGYKTFLGGKWHLNGGLEGNQHPQPQDHGFDYWMGSHNFALPTHKDPHNFYRNGTLLDTLSGFAAQLVIDEAIGWLDTVTNRHPFFMFLSMHEPHSEIASPDSFNLHYDKFTDGVVDLKNLRDRGPGEYYANVSHLDFQIGRFLSKLNQLGLDERTVVIFTSDNGPVTNQWRYWWEVNMYGETGGLRGRKADLYEGGIRVPFIIRYPGVVEPGTQSSVPLHGYDLLPTLAAITGAELPSNRVLDGVDFTPVLHKQDFNRSAPLFWAFKTRQYDDPYGYHYAARQGPWKIITDDQIEKVLLYNLESDPYEVREIAAEHPQVVSELTQFIKEMKSSIEDDPLRPIQGPQSIE